MRKLINSSVLAVVLPALMAAALIMLYVTIHVKVNRVEESQRATQQQQIEHLQEQQKKGCEERKAGRQVLHDILDASSPAFGNPAGAKNPDPELRQQTIDRFKARIPIPDCEKLHPED